MAKRPQCVPKVNLCRSTRGPDVAFYSRPVSSLSSLLLVLSVGLAISLVLALRRGSTVSPGQAQQSEPVAGDNPLASQIESAAHALPVGLIILDEAGSEVFTNESADAYLGPMPDDAVLKVRLRSFLDEAAMSSSPLQQDIELFSPARRLISLASAPLADGFERIGTAAFVDDVTSVSRINSMREDFIANAGHELKTPLGALRLLAEALEATEDAAVQKDLAQRIQAESARMTRIVEDILNLALIEEEHQDAEIVDLCDVVDAALDQTNLLAEASGVAVSHSCAHAAVSGDRRQLVSAVANLLENAIGYSAARGQDHIEPVKVTVTRGEGRATITVEDHGIGIPDRHQQRIFERFYRVDRGRSRARGGTGLGLSIVRHVVQNHHGRVWVESVPGEGSVFTIELPLAEN